MARATTQGPSAPRRDDNRDKAAPSPAGSSMRETVETFVVVFLAYFVLGLEAEAFVIPTGSMAPTLLGRHKEVTCPECGNVYNVNADREVNPDSAPVAPEARRVVGGTCDNCRFTTRIADEPNFQGDRLYVMKTPLSVPLLGWPALDGPRRWEVAVFKMPEDPEIRYIKRVVGMPGEIVRIARGDIWVGPMDGNGPFRRALRSTPHQDAMQVLVHDDRHRARSLAHDPVWNRWRPEPGAGASWKERETGRYEIDAASRDDWSQLRYRHVVPDPAQWTALARGNPIPHPPRATLITDFYAYNTDLTPADGPYSDAATKTWRHPNWVGDLMLRFRLSVEEARGGFRVELVRAGVPLRAEFDLERGSVRLLAGDRVLGEAESGITGSGSHDVAFANVDGRLSLRVDGNAIFGEGLSHETLDAPPALAPTAADLEPAAVAARGARVTVDHLLLTRDIYYTLRPARADLDGVDVDHPIPTDPVALAEWLSDPSQFTDLAKLGAVDYPVSPGHYLMLGDNSPWSSDSRAWRSTDQIDPSRPGVGWDESGRAAWEVPRNLLIGKAFCVYWPHLKPFSWSFALGRNVRLPARPYLERMRWIR